MYRRKRSLRLKIRKVVRAKRRGRISRRRRKRARRHLWNERIAALRLPRTKRLKVGQAYEVRNSLDRLTDLRDGLLLLNARLSRIQRRRPLSPRSRSGLLGLRSGTANLSLVLKRGVRYRLGALHSLSRAVYRTESSRLQPDPRQPSRRYTRARLALSLGRFFGNLPHQLQPARPRSAPKPNHRSASKEVQGVRIPKVINARLMATLIRAHLAPLPRRS